MDLRIRAMAPSEIALAANWAAAEGWNPGLNDAACFATVDPQGFLIGELDGKPAATISCVNYDDRFSFLGFYIVYRNVRYGGNVAAAPAPTQPEVTALSDVPLSIIAADDLTVFPAPRL